MGQKDKPFYTMQMTRSKLEMWAEYGDKIFDNDEERDQLLRDAHYTIKHLMAFRNIINGMVAFDQEPKEAAKPYVEED